MERRMWSYPIAFYLGLIFSAGACEAGPSVQEFWRALERSDRLLSASTVQWTRVVTVPGIAVDADKQAAQKSEQMRLEGASPEKTRYEVQFARDVVKTLRAGYKSYSRLSFEYEAGKVRASVMEGGDRLPSAKDGPTTVDLFDGVNSIWFQPGQGGGHGRLSRDPDDFLVHSAHDFADLVFLAGAPVTGSFPPGSTALREGPSGCIELETGDIFFRKDRIRHRVRMMISKSTWRPLSMDLLSGDYLSVSYRYVAAGYRHVAPGIWFPTRIAATGCGGVTEEYDLERASFNRPSGVAARFEVSPGAWLDDVRFPDRPVRYRVGHRLHTDREIRFLNGVTRLSGGLVFSERIGWGAGAGFCGPPAEASCGWSRARPSVNPNSPAFIPYWEAEASRCAFLACPLPLVWRTWSG